MPQERFFKLYESAFDSLNGSKSDLYHVFIWMCFKADAATGRYWGCSDSIAEQCGKSVAVAQGILVKLESKGLIRRLRNEATRGRYWTALEGYEVTVGTTNKGRRVCLEKSGQGLHGEVAYVGATGKTEEEEGDEPSELTAIAAAAPTPAVTPEPEEAPVEQHPMTRYTEDVFLKLGKKSGEHQLRALNKWLSEKGNGYVAERFEDLVAYACTKDYWAEHISSIHDLVWSLNRPSTGTTLREQFEEKQPNEIAKHRKALAATLAKRAKLAASNNR